MMRVLDSIKRFGCALLVASASASLAQPYPSRAVHLVVGIAPGGGLDGGARLVASKLSDVLGQPFLVENRPGAGGTIAAALVAKAPADGYTLLFGTPTLFIAPVLYEKLGFDPVKSFAPIGTAGSELLLIVANPSIPARNAAELIALLKANPGKYSYGTPGVGTVHHLAMEMFKKQAGVDVVHVPYKGAAPIVPDLISGVVPLAVMSMTTALPQAKAGKLKPIALTSPLRVAIAPDWPPLAETLPGFDAAPTRFVLAPAGTPAEVVNRLADALKAVLEMEEVKKIFASQATSGEFIGPAALAAKMRADFAKWTAAAKDSAARAEN